MISLALRSQYTDKQSIKCTDLLPIYTFYLHKYADFRGFSMIHKYLAHLHGIFVSKA